MNIASISALARFFADKMHEQSMFEIKPHDAPVMTRTPSNRRCADPADGLGQPSLALPRDEGNGVMDQVRANTPVVCSGARGR